MSNWVRLSPLKFLNLDLFSRVEAELGPGAVQRIRLYYPDSSFEELEGDEALRLYETMLFEASDLDDMQPPPQP